MRSRWNLPGVLEPARQAPMLDTISKLAVVWFHQLLPPGAFPGGAMCAYPACLCDRSCVHRFVARRRAGLGSASVCCSR